MFYGNVHNEFFESQAAVLPGVLCEALHFLKEADLKSHPVGNFPMEIGGVPVILQVMDRETGPRQEHYPEIHRKYADLQFFVSGGPETASFYIDSGKGTVREDLLGTPGDILFYENDPAQKEGSVVMSPGAYAIYFPWDVHIPGQCREEGPRAFRKIVMKIPVEACVR